MAAPKILEKPLESPILALPPELIDTICQKLPLEDVLSLRSSCQDMAEKSAYHLENRAFKEIRVSLTSQSRVGLNRLIDLSTHENVARRVEKITIHMNELTLLANSAVMYPGTIDINTSGHGSFTHDYRNKGLDLRKGQYTHRSERRQWWKHFVDPTINIQAQGIDMGMLWISLLRFRNLKTIEIKDHILPRLQHKMDTKIAQFVGPSGCNKCAVTNLRKCVHFQLFLDAVWSLTGDLPQTAGNFRFLAYNFGVPLEFVNTRHNATFTKLEQLNVLLCLGNLNKSQKEQYQLNFLRSLLESVAESIPTLSISERHAEGYMVPCYLKDISNLGYWRPSIERPISLLCMGTPSFMKQQNLRLATLELDAVTMSNLNLANLMLYNRKTLTKVRLESVNLVDRTFDRLDWDPILLILHESPKLKKLFIRAPMLENRCVLFEDYGGGEATLAEWNKVAKNWAPGEWSAFRTEITSEFRANAGYTGNRDLTGWSFEDGDIKAGVKYLRDFIKFGPNPKTYFTEET